MIGKRDLEDLHKKIQRLVEADGASIAELIKLANLDPQKDFCGADLAGIDLSGFDLKGADLRYCNFEGAILNGSNLLGANLTKANLQSADLRDACLDKANLAGANLAAAKLRGATFREAELTGAHLSKSYLDEADFSRAKFRGALFSDATTEPPTFQFEDVPLEEARRMGRGPRMEPMLYETLRQKIQSLADQAARIRFGPEIRPGRMKNYILRIARDINVPVMVRRVPGGVIFWRSTEEDLQLAKDVASRFQTARQRRAARSRGRQRKVTR
jgi:uncharacterized protein YjbI with pentapeptide repeats